MLNEETHQKLMAMKMYGLATAFEEYLDERRHDKLSFEERFGLMVDREWFERQERRLKRRLRVAKLREQACTEDINYRHPRNLDRSVIQRLTKCKWIGDHENVLISGATGLGKTWLACALANKACREGFSATYTRVPRLMHNLQIAKADGTYMKELARLAKTDVLLLDDLGLSPIGDIERRDLLEILEDRHGNCSTIVTSQFPIKKWHDTIGDPTISDAFLDRLLNRAHRIELKGRSMRPRAPEPESAGSGSRARKSRKG
ncbi:MAG: IS21-like element helper ATPase IstB [Actinomycetota bacterium]|nr:IS21-like element helper ATPase IstB [Actinomycetota bacterium]